MLQRCLVLSYEKKFIDLRLSQDLLRIHNPICFTIFVFNKIFHYFFTDVQLLIFDKFPILLKHFCLLFKI